MATAILCNWLYQHLKLAITEKVKDKNNFLNTANCNWTGNTGDLIVNPLNLSVQSLLLITTKFTI